MKILIVSALLFRNLAAAPPSIFSVCEAARAEDRLDGKTVRISGVWRQSNPALEIFDELVDTTCPEVGIHVVATVASLPHPPPPVGYKLDAKSTQIAQHVAEKALADGRDLSATIVGVLSYRRKRTSSRPSHASRSMIHGSRKVPVLAPTVICRL